MLRTWALAVSGRITGRWRSRFRELAVDQDQNVALAAGQLVTEVDGLEAALPSECRSARR
jgi:hypothetical protein